MTNSHTILVGYSGSLFENLLKENSKLTSEFIVLEDNNEKCSFLKNFDVRPIKVMTFYEGIEYISNSNDSFKLYLSVSSSPKKRILARNLFKTKNIAFPSIFQESAKISMFSNISKGVYLGDFTTIESNTKINEFSFINSHTHIGHDSNIGRFCLLGGSVIVNGQCLVEDYCFLGSSVTVINGKRIGKGSVIQAGTVITEDIPDFSFVNNNPFKVFPVGILGKEFQIASNN